jgi:hypothetical protein
MKAWSLAGILVVAVPLLFSTTGHAWYVSYEVTDCEEYMDGGGNGDYYPYSDYGGAFASYSYADVWAFIEGEEQYTWAGAYAYVYWTETILGYDPEWDPPLLANVTSLVYTAAYALYDLDDSDYEGDAAATGYANGYSTSAYVEISDPEAGDIDTDWFDEDIDIYENGYPIYLREFAYAVASTLTTEDKVKLVAYAESDTACTVDQNP